MTYNMIHFLTTEKNSWKLLRCKTCVKSKKLSALRVKDEKQDKILMLFLNLN